MNHQVTDITAPSVLRGIPKDLRDAVKGAARLGWTGRKTGTGGLILYSPDGVSTVNIPITLNRVNTARAIARDILRHTPDDIKVSVAAAVVDNNDRGGIEAMGHMVLDASGAFGPTVAAGIGPEVDETETAYVTPEDVPHEPEHFGGGGAPVTVVSVEPWMARVSSNGAKADLYPSQAVIQRNWSDGSIDYLCAYKECKPEFTSTNPRSVSSHYAGHTRAGDTNRTVQEATVFDAKIDGYRTVRIAHLAKEVLAALTAESDSINDSLPMDDLARRIAEHIIKDRLAKGREKVEEDSEPSTPEDVLARIKRLVMRDEQDHLHRAEAEAENLRRQIVEVEAERDTAKAAVTRYKETLATLAGLAREEAGTA